MLYSRRHTQFRRQLCDIVDSPPYLYASYMPKRRSQHPAVSSEKKVLPLVEVEVQWPILIWGNRQLLHRSRSQQRSFPGPVAASSALVPHHTLHRLCSSGYLTRPTVAAFVVGWPCYLAEVPAAGSSRGQSAKSWSLHPLSFDDTGGEEDKHGGHEDILI